MRFRSAALLAPVRFRRRLLALLALLAALHAPAAARAQDGARDGAQDAEAGDSPPKVALPEDATTPTYWVLSVRPHHLRMITPRRGPAKGRVYWYLVYTLENPSSEDRDIYVGFTATSDRDKTYGDVYLPFVERAIEARERTPLWGKTDEFEILSERDPEDPKYQYLPIKAGEKRLSVAVFNRLDPNANHVTIEIRGLSNEVKTVAKEDGTKWLEERVRVLKFDRPGDEFTITRDSFDLKAEDWIRHAVKLEIPAEAASP